MEYNALFIGLTTIDIQYFVDNFPESNAKLKTQTPDILVGGPATNAAISFSKLNNGTTLVSVTGQNTFTDFYSADFRETNINHVDMAMNQNVNPVLASVITSSNGDRNIFTNNAEDINTNIDVNKLFDELKPQIILLDGFYPEFGLKCAKLAQKKSIPVVIDCGSWKKQFEELLNYTDIAICSADFYPPNCKNYEQVINYFQFTNNKKIAVTRGEKSIIYFENGIGEVPVKKAIVVDTLGAGDFLHGAFCYYYLKTNQFKKALAQASEIASFSCKFPGTRKWLEMV